VDNFIYNNINYFHLALLRRAVLSGILGGDVVFFRWQPGSNFLPVARKGVSR